ncbi:MAG: 2-oxo acid dehydrogenase subunit E2 [Planctomycetes bacterium]|nr:2-oxo acid dehydrogenase subunit E2 [Planctomycetota bacterium]
MTLKEFRLPDIGEGIAEGEIVAWKVKPGQSVKEEDEFVEVMTDKATVMITAPYTGVVKELRFKEGDVVPVESVIAVFEVGGAAGASPVASTHAAPAAHAAPVAPASQAPSQAPSQPAVASAPAARGAIAPVEFEQAEPGKVLAAPATRRRARELGVDLHQVLGTGPSGRITNEDLDRHLSGITLPTSVIPAAAQRPESAAPAKPAAPAAKPVPVPRAPVAIAPAPAGATEERIPFRGLRRKIAEAMTRSKHTAAHFTYVDDIDVTKLVALRKEAKALFAEQGVNITYLPFIMKAVVEAHRRFPMMNSSLDEASQELVVKRYYNFGIATDTEQGLIVPVIKDVDRKSIAQLAWELQDLATRTREGKVGIDQLQGGTFSITNAGNIGGLFATPVINFPEVAILGVHAIKKTPVVDAQGQIVVGDVMYLSVSIDHRLVDGATGARWMNVVKDCLENPTRLLVGSL